MASLVPCAYIIIIFNVLAGWRFQLIWPALLPSSLMSGAVNLLVPDIANKKSNALMIWILLDSIQWTRLSLTHWSWEVKRYHPVPRLVCNDTAFGYLGICSWCESSREIFNNCISDHV